MLSDLVISVDRSFQTDPRAKPADPETAPRAAS